MYSYFIFGNKLNRRGRCKRGTVDDTFKCTAKEDDNASDDSVIQKDRVSESVHSTGGKIDLNSKIEYKNDHDGIKKFRTLLSKNDIKTIDGYVGSGYPGINKFLRKTEIFSNDSAKIHKKDILLMDKIVDSYALPDDLLLFRGANNKMLYDLEVGDSLFDPAFTSATEDIKWAETFINRPVPDENGYLKVDHPTLLVISAKRGQHAAPVSSLKFPLEREFVLPRGIQFRVNNVKSNGKLKIVEVSIS